MTTCRLGVKQTQIGQKLSANANLRSEISNMALVFYFDILLINYSYNKDNLSFGCQTDSKLSTMTNLR